jgi:VIT1/CCC1 family predicted Fe2+/Mn2+ transporter
LDGKEPGVLDEIHNPEPLNAGSAPQSPCDAVSESPSVLPGPAGATLILAGILHNGAAVLVGCLLTIEAYLPGRWYFWAGAILAVAAVILVTGLVKTRRGYRKLAEETRRGYTTALGFAWDDTSLYYVDRVSLQVIAGPHEPRPRHRKSR